MPNDRDDLFLRLYINEDVHGSIGSGLRQRGYDVLTVGEAERVGLSFQMLNSWPTLPTKTALYSALMQLIILLYTWTT